MPYPAKRWLDARPFANANTIVVAPRDTLIFPSLPAPSQFAAQRPRGKSIKWMDVRCDANAVAAECSRFRSCADAHGCRWLGWIACTTHPLITANQLIWAARVGANAEAVAAAGWSGTGSEPWMENTLSLLAAFCGVDKHGRASRVLRISGVWLPAFYAFSLRSTWRASVTCHAGDFSKAQAHFSIAMHLKWY